MGTRGPQPAARTAEIVARIASGRDALIDLAAEYGLSRQRLTQIAQKHGVMEAYRANRAALKPEPAPKVYLTAERYGVSPSEWRELVASGATRAYQEQKSNATKRGVEWRFDLVEWWAVWAESGKWAERGKNSGQYVMARFGDVGPYAPWNVEIVTCNENMSQWRRRDIEEKACNPVPDMLQSANL